MDGLAEVIAPHPSLRTGAGELRPTDLVEQVRSSEPVDVVDDAAVSAVAQAISRASGEIAAHPEDHREDAAGRSPVDVEVIIPARQLSRAGAALARRPGPRHRPHRHLRERLVTSTLTPGTRAATAVAVPVLGRATTQLTGCRVLVLNWRDAQIRRSPAYARGCALAGFFLAFESVLDDPASGLTRQDYVDAVVGAG